MNVLHRIFLICGLLTVSMASAVHAEESSTGVLAGFFAEHEQRMNNRDYDTINASIDLDSVLRTAFEGVEVDDDFREEFMRGFKSKARSGISQAIMGKMPNHTRVKMIKVDADLKQGEAIYRLDYGDSGYVYLRFRARQQITGEIRITDWFDYSRGEYYSTSLGTIIYSVAPASGVMGLLSDLGSDKSSERQVMQQMASLMRGADYAGMKALFVSSSDELRNNWPILVTFVGAASLSGDDDFYRSVLNEVASRFGDDERAAFLLIDYYYFEQSIDKALVVLDALFEEFGRNDAGILFLKLSAYLELEQWDKAREMAHLCIEIEPDFEDAYWNLVSLDINQENYAAVVDHLDVIASQFGYEFTQEDFVDNEFYDGFVQSSDYADWMQ